MKILSGGQANFFGLDLGTTSLRAVQLKGTGPMKSLYKYAHLPVEGNFVMSEAEADRDKLIKALHQLVNTAGIETKKVAVNLPSSQVFTTVVEMDRMSPQDLGKTIQYQAGGFIPTPIEESKVDWAVIGDSPANPNKEEVLLSSVPNRYVEERFAMLEAAGFKVIAFEPDSMALIRAIVPADSTQPQMVLDIGRMACDLVVAMNGFPHLTRVIPTGTSSFIKAVQTGLNIDEAQASEFVYKFGLVKDKLDGQIYSALMPSVEGLMSEIEKSIKFFQNRYPNNKLDHVIVTGGASSIPELPLYVANRFGLNVEIGNAWRNVSFPAGQQNELLALSNHFGVAVGLAERSK